MKKLLLIIFIFFWASLYTQTRGIYCEFPKAKIVTEPTYAGGKAQLDKFVAKNFTYPKNWEEQTLIIYFTVRENGTISDISVKNNIYGKAYEKKLISMVKKMPRWNPATEDGKPIPYQYKLPIRLKEK